jgi:RNA polymerase sigma-70 factor, ECF subfamily
LSSEETFRRLIEPHRPALHAHCYRMLGSRHDADDALQNTLLRAWRALPRFQGRSSPRSWLYRIATNVCLDTLARRPPPALPLGDGPDIAVSDADGEAMPEALYERRESVELAFSTALQHLPACQRAALILRDVLGFSAKEAAEALDTTVASVNGTLYRARHNAEERLPAPHEQRPPRPLGNSQLQQQVARLADAFERGEVDTILTLLIAACRGEPARAPRPSPSVVGVRSHSRGGVATDAGGVPSSCVRPVISGVFAARSGALVDPPVRARGCRCRRGHRSPVSPD